MYADKVSRSVDMSEKKTVEFSVYGCHTCGSVEFRPSTFVLGRDVEPCRCGGQWYVRRAGKHEVPDYIRHFWSEA
jgi:hypothetical protein